MYIKHDQNNQQVSPQPVSIAVTQFSGNEGWSTITYYDWNGDYVRHDESNQVGISSSYVRHDENNNPVAVIDSYQRHDENNNPIYQ
jgi:hypothetical protein